jgi:diphthamide synthase (EF-2-diphthine--ammonia ligase)
LEDIRAYREAQLAGTGLDPIFPLWLIPTEELGREIIRSGLRAIITCVDRRWLSDSFAGREYDESLLMDLPQGVDKCGERGEFHTFTYDGPMFQQALKVAVGEVVERDGFIFANVGDI